MTDSQEEPEYIDAELVDDDSTTRSFRTDKPKLLGPFAGLQLIDDQQGRSFLTELKRMGVPISDKYLPENAGEMSEFIDATVTGGPGQVEVLSKALYDIALIAERRNLELHPDLDGHHVDCTAALEQIMVMIATAPLTQHYALRLAGGR